MKQILLMIAVMAASQSVLAADKKPLTKEESARAIEAAIRKQIKKTTGELTKANLEKVIRLDLEGTYITDLTHLSKLTELKHLWLENTPISDLMPLVALTKLEGIGLQNNLKLTKAELDKFRVALLKGNAQSSLAKETKIDPATGIPTFPRPQGKKQQWTTFGAGQDNLAAWKGLNGRTVLKFFGTPDSAKSYGAYGGGVWTYSDMKVTTANQLKAERVYFVVGRGVVHSVHLFPPAPLSAPAPAVDKRSIALVKATITASLKPNITYRTGPLQGGIAVLVGDLGAYWVKNGIVYNANGFALTWSPRNRRTPSSGRVIIGYAEVKSAVR
jgi:hypothetical protein